MKIMVDFCTSEKYDPDKISVKKFRAQNFVKLNKITKNLH